MTRLTDEELARIESQHCLCNGCEPDIADKARAMATELRARRAADLSKEELVHIEDASAFMIVALTQAQKMGSDKGANSAARIIATLDKLLGGRDA